MDSVSGVKQQYYITSPVVIKFDTERVINHKHPQKSPFLLYRWGMLCCSHIVCINKGTLAFEAFERLPTLSVSVNGRQFLTITPKPASLQDTHGEIEKGKIWMDKIFWLKGPGSCKPVIDGLSAVLRCITQCSLCKLYRNLSVSFTHHKIKRYN